jgi:hypothetical protein
MNKKIKSRIMSKTNNISKLISEKNINFGLMNAKNVSILRSMQTKESTITNLKFLKIFNIQKPDLIYTNII